MYMWLRVPLDLYIVVLVLNFAVAYIVSIFTKNPPAHIQELVESVRIPRGTEDLKSGHK